MQNLLASSSQLQSDYPLPPASAQWQEARGRTDHLTQAAAVDAQVLKGAFSERKIIIMKKTEQEHSSLTLQRRVDALDSRLLCYWKETAAHLGNTLHVGPFAITRRRAAPLSAPFICACVEEPHGSREMIYSY